MHRIQRVTLRVHGEHTRQPRASSLWSLPSRASPCGGEVSLVRVHERYSVRRTGFHTPSTCLTPDLQSVRLGRHRTVRTSTLLVNGSHAYAWGTGQHRGSPKQAPGFRRGGADCHMPPSPAWTTCRGSVSVTERSQNR